MAETYDVVVAGGGHNGLTVAAYLTKAGFNVCVAERNDTVGGGVISKELAAPGFKSDPCSTIHLLTQYSPLFLNDELGLRKDYGLKYLYPEVQMCIHFTDGTTLSICRSMERTIENIAKYSQKDAENYRKFCTVAQAGAQTIVQGFYSPAPTFGLFSSMMDASDEGRELMRYMMISTQDVIDEWFEHPKVRIAFTRWISEIMVNPNAKGTGIMVFVMLGLAHMAPGGGLPIGGSGALSEAMEKYILDNGGTIKVNSEVTKIITQNGEAKGVRLASGEEIYGSKMVVANLNPQLIFPRMVDASEVPPEYQMKVDRLRHSFSAFNQSLALNEAPNWTVNDPDLSEAFLTEFAPCDPLEYKHYFNNFLDDGIITPGTNVHFPLASVQSVHDPSRAPEGKHICYFYEYAPYNLQEGGAARWDEYREEFAQGMLDFVKPWVTNLDSTNIIGQYIQSPLDLERMNPSFVHGDFGGIASFLDQFMGNRPIGGMPNGAYSTPIDKLMICGPSCHPGSGASCGGRAAATAILEALGKDMDDVVS